jgi:hypothetical protein
MIMMMAAGFAGNVLAAQTETQVSPSAINLATSGLEMTIHTEVPFSAVVSGSVNAAFEDAQGADFDLVVQSTFADAQGHLVLKIDWEGFLEVHIKDVSTGVATFYIDGEVYIDGVPDPFQGMDTARIIKAGKK